MQGSGQQWSPYPARKWIPVAYFTIRLFLTDLTPSTLLAILPAPEALHGGGVAAGAFSAHRGLHTALRERGSPGEG